MPPDHARWQRVQQLVDGALDLPATQRAAFLARQCAGDEALQGEVARLLAACDRAARGGGLLATPAAELAAPLIAALRQAPPEGALAIIDRLNAALAGEYRVERELARGGMATVFLARDLRHERTVAIKVVEHEGEAAAGARFLREIRTAAGLTHPHLLTVHDSGAADGLLYFVMPYVAGETLRARLAREGTLSLPEVLRLVNELADALAYAHANGVVHCDLKPENVLLSGGHAVIADFGIARALAAASTAGHADDVSAPASSTTSSSALGTPRYMAPEQFQRPARVDHRADLYALGLIAYEALAGGLPFAGSTPDVAAPLPSGLPPACATLIERLLASDPAARPQSAQEVLRSLDAPTPPPRHGRRRNLVAAALVLLITAGGYGAWRSAARDGAGRAAHTPNLTVAVLPFVNASRAPADDYLGDGLTDELAQALARLSGVRVAGRMSSYAFKGRAVPPREIGRALDATVLITGSILRAGDRVRVSMQLVSAADGTVLWGDSYEGSGRDLFAVQDEFMRATLAAVATVLGTGDEQRSLGGTRGTNDQEAYDLYLRGRYFYLERGAGNLDRAINHLQAAIARDPTFARAHAGLALTYGVLPFYRPDRAIAAGELMAASAARALALDSTLADAHIAAGGNADRLLDFARAERHFRKALELEPANVTGHHWYGFMLSQTGRTDEAIAELGRAVQLDPLAKSAGTAYAGALIAERRFPEAIAEARRVLRIDSTFTLALYALGQAQAFGGDPDSAIMTLEHALRLQPDARWQSLPLLYAYAAAGRWRDAEQLRDRLGATGEAAPEAAFAEFVFGNRDALVQLLASSEGQGEWYNTQGFGCNPLNDPLWQDTRFVAAMRRLAIRPCTLARPWPFRSPSPG